MSYFLNKTETLWSKYPQRVSGPIVFEGLQLHDVYSNSTAYLLSDFYVVASFHERLQSRELISFLEEQWIFIAWLYLE